MWIRDILVLLKEETQTMTYTLDSQYTVRSSAFRSIAFGTQQGVGDIVVVEYNNGVRYLFSELTDGQMAFIRAAVNIHVTGGGLSIGSPIASILGRYAGRRLD